MVGTIFMRKSCGGGGWERKFQEAGEKWADHLEWIEGEELHALRGENRRGRLRQRWMEWGDIWGIMISVTASSWQLFQH